MSKLEVGTGPMGSQILCHTSEGVSCGSMTSQPFTLMTGASFVGSIKGRGQSHMQKVRALWKWQQIWFLPILDGYGDVFRMVMSANTPIPIHLTVYVEVSEGCEP